MSKNNPIQLDIPHPCTQNWDEMTSCGTGRFCSHCQKTVIDFTALTDTALYNFFSKNTEPVCGRMFAAQLQRPVNIPPQPHSRLYRLAVALGLTLIFGDSQLTLGQNRPPKVEQIPILKKTDFSTDRMGTISGSVYDYKQPLADVKIEVYYGRILKVSTKTNSQGTFTIAPLKVGYYNLIATFPKYDIHKVLDVYTGYGDTAYLDIRLSHQNESAPKTRIEYYRDPIDINGSILTGQIKYTTLKNENSIKQKNDDLDENP